MHFTKSNFLLIYSPDIFVFDDILSALDLNVGTFLMEETILKQLKGKTIIMVTHALQYLRFADKVYLIELGTIKQSGTFEEIKSTELYTQFQSFINVVFYKIIEFKKKSTWRRKQQ